MRRGGGGERDGGAAGADVGVLPRGAGADHLQRQELRRQRQRRQRRHQASDGGVEGGVRRGGHGDAGDPGGNVLHRPDPVPRALQVRRHHLHAPGDAEGGHGPEAVRQRLDRVRVGEPPDGGRPERHHRRPGRRLLALQQVPRPQGLQSPPHQRAVRQQPEHGGQGHPVGEQQVLPHRAAQHQQRPDEQPPDQRPREQPQHGRDPHRALQRGLHLRHQDQHGRRLHLHRPGERQRRHLPRPLRPRPRHERRLPGPLRRRGGRDPDPRQGHDLRGHHERGPDQDMGELPHQEPRRTHGVREYGHEGRAEPNHHRPEVLPLLQLRAQVRVRGHHQGHPVQEHQGHGVAARRRHAPLRRAVPGRRAAGRRPQVQGPGRGIVKVRERQGQVHRLPVPEAMPLALPSRFFFFFFSKEFQWFGS